MDIEEFYDSDARRRSSTEIEFGTEWRSKSGARYQLNWVEDTGEVYVMREPVPFQSLGPFGEVRVNASDSAPTDGMTVAVIARVATRAELETILAGWESEMPKPDSTAWLENRLQSAGVALWSENAPE